MAKRAARKEPDTAPAEPLARPPENDNGDAPKPEPADAPRAKAEKQKPGPLVAMAVRMSATIAAEIKGRFRVTIPIPKDETIRDVKVGARFFLREWAGAPTGRADLVTVVSVGEDDGHEHFVDRCTVERRWCWLSGKTDDDLAFLAVNILPEHFPAIGF